jgi:hypothetical protein
VVLHFAFGTVSTLDLIAHLFLCCIFFSTLLLVSDVAVSGRANQGYKHLFWLLPLLLIMGGNYVWTSTFRYLSARIPSDGAFVISSFGRELPLPVWAREGPLSVYKQSVSEPTTVWRVHKALRIPPGYFLVMVTKTGACLSLDSFVRSGSVKILTSHPVQPSSPSPAIYRSFEMTPCEGREMCDFHFKAVVNGCISDDFFETVVARMYAMGFDSFALQASEL